MQTRSTTVIDKPVEADETNQLIHRKRLMGPLFTTAVTTSVRSTT
jgi:hypothetical protein